MDLAFQTSSIHINPTTTNNNNNEHEHDEEEISDPLQQWLLFDPPPIPHQEQHHLNLSSSTSSFQSINDQSIHLNPINTSMPSHDGTGHFFTPPAPLSPTTSEYNYHHPITTQSLRSFSEIDSQNDDLLSIPSSLSISHSGSSRSSNLRTHITPSESMSPEDSELLLTPMAISAGLSHHNTSIGTQRLSSRSSHQSIDRRARRSTTGGSHSRRTHSHSSHRSRIRPINSRRSSSRNPPPVVLIPSHAKKINLLPANRQAALDFLTSVASKILDLDSDTMNMLSTPHENQTSKSQASTISRSHTTKNRLPPRFSIGDDARRSLTSQEKDMISSPMDLSGFMPPSPRSIWRMSEERAEEEEEEEEQESVVGQDDDERDSSRCLRKRQYGSSATLKTQSYHNYDPRHSSPSTIASTIQDPRQLRGRPNSGFQDPDLDLQPHSLLPSSDTEPDTEPLSTGSMATILLKRVLDEWTNW